MPGKLEVTLIKSVIGRPEKHRKVVKSLGLGKLHSVAIHDDRPEIRGMIATVSHLVSVTEK